MGQRQHGQHPLIQPLAPLFAFACQDGKEHGRDRAGSRHRRAALGGASEAPEGAEDLRADV